MAFKNKHETVTNCNQLKLEWEEPEWMVNYKIQLTANCSQLNSQVNLQKPSIYT